MHDYLIIDIGSTYTKQRLIDGHRLTATAQTPTSLEDVYASVLAGQKELAGQLDKPPRAARTYASSSAAGGLRMVAMGFMARVTARAAKEVAMNSGAKILEIISAEDPPDYRIQILQEIRPDIILLAGGTDYGDEQSLVENAGLIVESGVRAMVVVAGNIAAQPAAAAILEGGGVTCIRVPNIMPTIHELRVEQARQIIHREFIRQITRAGGLRRFQETLSDEQVIPTPGAVLLAAELLACGSRREKGLGDLLVIDLGGATTDVHSVIPGNADLPPEEIGLIVTNARQVSSRTVEGNLGMRVSATGVVQTVDPREIIARTGRQDDQKAGRLADYCALLEREPSRLPTSAEEEEFDVLLAQTAVEVALKRHAGYIVTEPNPVTGLSPGMPVGRDLRHVRTVVAVGGFFAHRDPADARSIVAAALSRRGISLLPGKADVLVDSDYLLYTGGVIGMRDEDYAFSLLKRYFMECDG